MWSIGYSHQHGWSIGPRHLSCSGIHSSLISGESQGCPPVRVHTTATRMTCDQEKSARHLERSVHSMMSTSAPKALVWPHQQTQDARLWRIPSCTSDSSHSILCKIAELFWLSYDLTDKLVEPVPLGSQDGPSGFNVASTCITYMSQTFKRTCLQDM